MVVSTLQVYFPSLRCPNVPQIAQATRCMEKLMRDGGAKDQMIWRSSSLARNQMGPEYVRAHQE